MIICQTSPNATGRSVAARPPCPARARRARGRPVIVLLHGAGDGLDKLAAVQETLSRQDRVCSYDRLGSGASDRPAGPQDIVGTGKILTGVLEQVAGDCPVVLAGHWMGGLIAARYASGNRDRVKGLVLVLVLVLDATLSTMLADIKTILESAEGPVAEIRAQNLAIFQGQTPERLVITDGEVCSAGDILMEVIQHGKPYLEAVPEYGPRLEQAWAAGRRKWLALSSGSRLSTASNSGHCVYLDRPDVAVQAIERLTVQVARQTQGGRRWRDELPGERTRTAPGTLDIVGITNHHEVVGNTNNVPAGGDSAAMVTVCGFAGRRRRVSDDPAHP